MNCSMTASNYNREEWEVGDQWKNLHFCFILQTLLKALGFSIHNAPLIKVCKRQGEEEKNVQLFYLPDTENKVVNRRRLCYCVLLRVFARNKKYDEKSKGVGNYSFFMNELYMNIYSYIWWNWKTHYATRNQKQAPSIVDCVFWNEGERGLPLMILNFSKWTIKTQWEGILLLMEMSDQGWV